MEKECLKFLKEARDALNDTATDKEQLLSNMELIEKIDAYLKTLE